MKKALAILTVLAVVAGAAFADVADVAITGNATLTWGVDLDQDNSTAFSNGAEWSVTIPLLTKQTFTTKSEGDAYAEISVKDAGFTIRQDHDASGDGVVDGDSYQNEDTDVSAKLVFGDIYMTIYGAPGFTTDYSTLWSVVGKGDAPDTVEYGEDIGGGTEVGYTAEKFTVAGKIASRDAWDAVGGDTDANEQHFNKYAFAGKVTATPSDMVSLEGQVAYFPWEGTVTDVDGEVADAITAFGVKATVKPVADLTVGLAFEGDTEGEVTTEDGADRALSYEAKVSVAYKTLVEVGAMYANATGLVFLDGMDADGNSISDLTAFVKVTDGDMVENLNAWANVTVGHLLTSTPDGLQDADGNDVSWPAPILYGIGADYTVKMNDVNYVKPFFSYYAQNWLYGADYEALAGGDLTTLEQIGDEGTFSSAVELGADYGLFTNTVITAKWVSGATDDFEVLFPYGKIVTTDSKSEKGKFTLACKVTY